MPVEIPEIILPFPSFPLAEPCSGPFGIISLACTPVTQHPEWTSPSLVSVPISSPHCTLEQGEKTRQLHLCCRALVHLVRTLSQTEAGALWGTACCDITTRQGKEVRLSGTFQFHRGSSYSVSLPGTAATRQLSEANVLAEFYGCRRHLRRRPFQPRSCLTCPPPPWETLCLWGKGPRKGLVTSSLKKACQALSSTRFWAW